jgi:uncharacterized protein YsxB (DUF464 family)
VLVATGPAQVRARHLKKGHEVVCSGISVMYCLRAPVATLKKWRRKKLDKPTQPEANRLMSDEALLVHIRAVHA